MRIEEIRWDEVGLGRYSDRDLAQHLGLVASQVLAQRRKRGIAAAPPGAPPPPRTYRVARIAWGTVGLGTRPDKTIATELGVPTALVRRRRLQLGIQAFRPEPIASQAMGRTFGFYWLGLFAWDTSEVCAVPSCCASARKAAAFLLRGHPITLLVCRMHSETVERWGASPDASAVEQLTDALYRSSSGLRGRLHGDARVDGSLLGI